MRIRTVCYPDESRNEPKRSKAEHQFPGTDRILPAADHGRRPSGVCIPADLKLLVLLIATDKVLLMMVTALCYVVFALFYMLVYAVTSREYFRIVSGKKDNRG